MNNKIKVILVWELSVNWKLQDLSENELIKFLFYYAKKHIISKLQENNLSSFEEVVLSPDKYTEYSCPVDISRIPNPQNFSFEVELDSENMTINNCLDDFIKFIKSEKRMSFWRSENRVYNWISKPEKLVKDFLHTFLTGRYKNDMAVFEEITSGAGKIDILIVTPKNEKLIVELKMCGHRYSAKYALSGIEQIFHYMENKNAFEGYLVIFDSRTKDFFTGFPNEQQQKNMKVKIKIADVRPYVKIL